MSRPSFRPRPVDIHKKLPIVKSIRDLDIDESVAVSRTLLHGHNVENEAVQSILIKRRSDIPTPQFIFVESYERDYTRSFLQPQSYVRSRGARSDAVEYVEYDLDNEDDVWLQEINNEQKLLSPERFEWMLYKLELLDYKARERPGGMPITFGVPVSVTLQHDAAVEALRSEVPKLAVLTAVYDYWKSKREHWQKPILRRLQPPPPVNDTNPFNVFRPREKVLQRSRRLQQRRENDVLSFEKLRQVRHNLDKARSLLLMIQKREEKKREVVECEANLQGIQMTFKMDDDILLSSNHTMMAPYAYKSFPFKKEDGIYPVQQTSFTVGTPDFVNGSVRMQAVTDLIPPFVDYSTIFDHLEQSRCKGRRRRFPQSRGRPAKKIATVDPMEPVMLFAKPIDSGRLAAAGIVPPLDPPCATAESEPPYHYRGRMGRGGRLIFDRWDPLSRTPLGCNPFSLCSRSSDINRSDPPPPRLNSEKTDPPSIVNTGATDGNLDPPYKVDLPNT